MKGNYEQAKNSTDADKISEWESANLFNKWTFSCVTPMLNIGYNRALRLEELMKLPKKDHVEDLSNRMQMYFETSRAQFGFPRLMVAAIKTVAWDSMVVNFYSVIEGFVRIASCVVLRLLLAALQYPTDPEKSREAYMWAGILGAIGVSQAIIHHILFLLSMKTGNNVKIAVMGMIYKRLFKLKSNALMSQGTGKMVNLISNDVSRFEDFATFQSFFHCSLLEMLAITIILIYQLNVASAFAGVGVTLLCIPIQMKLAGMFAATRTSIAAATDKRVRFISEVIDGISSVKAYAWELPFFDLISKLRDVESKNIQRSMYIRSFNMGVYFFGPSMASFGTFVVYWATGQTLTLPLIFSTMSLLQQLRVSMGRQWTMSIQTASEAFASCHRIENFLSLTDDDNDNNKNPVKSQEDDCSTLVPNTGLVEMVKTESTDEANVLVEVSNGYFTYSLNGIVEKEEEIILNGINFQVKRGELLMIVGSVGAGKSSLLASLLGETNQLQGHKSKGNTSVTIRAERLAYCQQKPWIVSSSVRGNIMMAGRADDGSTDFRNPKVVNQELYEKALEVCNILHDLDQWPDYDESEIGESGVSLSGGQRARLSLARAVYSDADVCLLDDPLSACDARVGSKIFHSCILGHLKGAGTKAVILTTHQLQYLPFADKIIVLDNGGHQVFYGNYDELMKRESEFSFLELQTRLTGLSPSSSHLDLANKKTEKMSDSTNQKVDVPDANANASEGKGTKKVEEVVPELKYDKDWKAKREASKENVNIIITEDRVEGTISSKVVLEYIKNGGALLGSYVCLLALTSQVLVMITDYWVKFWCTNTYFSDQSDVRNVWIFGILTSACLVMGIWRANVFFQFTLKASCSLHLNCLWSVLHLPSSFFIANPTGRILNRFSKDQNLADEALPVTLFDYAENCTLFCLAAAVLACIAIPWLCLIMAPLLYVFQQFREKYIRSSREIKRLESVSRSPIYSDFSSTLEGLVTLKAYKLEARVDRSFQRVINENTKCWFNFLMVSRWLGFRMDCISAIVLIAIVILAVILRNTIDVGLIGYAIVYTMTLSGLMQWTVRQSAEVETQMTSIERISTYSNMPSEPGYRTTLDMHLQAKSNRIESSDNNDSSDSNNSGSSSSIITKYRSRSRSRSKSNDASKGNNNTDDDKDNSLSNITGASLSIRGLQVKYRDDLDLVIKDLTLEIPRGCKVGVVGRTGSGKSTLFLAFLRLNLIVGGDILIDGKSILEMDLETARGNFSVIPQDAHLFSGTVRFNLDPFNVYTDDAIWRALTDAHINDVVSKDPLGLSMKVEEGGNNLSVGQRQLLSLSRAILRRSNVVLMDEVTASIDYYTDRLIQETIRTSPSLKDATIITIAHRLRTVADADIVAVMGDGYLLEVGKPTDLLANPASHFHKLAQNSNEFDEIVEIARGKTSSS